jgi:DNA-binding NtrC family response regulator
MNEQSLRALIIEDSEDDVLLLVRALKKNNYNPFYERVETPADMKKALEEKQWDIILCDYKMPNFSGPSALALLKEANIDIPFIIVSGVIDETMAVECMRLGAKDYVLKTNLSRLSSVIARELEDAQVRKKQKQIEEKLNQEEQRFRAFVEHSSDIIVILNLERTITYINPAVEQVLGFKPEERIGAKGFELSSCTM